MGLCPRKGAYTLNHVPNNMVQKTTYEIWIGKRQSMSFMKVLRCETF